MNEPYAGRNLLDIFDLDRDPRFHAFALAWLLHPHGEHGLGMSVLARLANDLSTAGTPWLTQALAHGVENVSTEILVGVGRCDVVLTLDQGRVLIFGGPPAQDEVGVVEVSVQMPALNQGDLVAITEGAVAWSWDSVLAALENATPYDGYTHMLVHIREHLRNLCSGALPEAPVATSMGAEEVPAEREALAEESVSDERLREEWGSGVFDPVEEEVDFSQQEAPSMILSDDMSRAYQVTRPIGAGGQGMVFEVEIQGDQEFEQFKRDVHWAVIKVAKANGRKALEAERAAYERPDRGLIRMLDHGEIQGGEPFLVLERLHPHPFERFQAKQGSVAPLDLATAIDTFVNLVEILQGIHFNKERPLLLIDIKPENIMLRMSNDAAEIELDEYMRRIATGAYEPVFMDVGCAQNLNELRANDGVIGRFVGTPLYLPPEAVPIVEESRTVPGVYTTKTDIYALTLSFYQYVTGALPYAHRGLFQLNGRDRFFELLAFKRERVDPIDSNMLYSRLDGGVARDIEEVLRAGLHPDPEKRATTQALSNLCKQRFKIVERREKEVGTYCFDAVKGLRVWQSRFPRINPQSNVYMRNTRSLPKM